MLLVERIYVVVGSVLLIIMTAVGLRMISYWRSFFLHWRRYRRRAAMSTDELRKLPVPYVKIQITTRGSPGSSEVILRGIRNVARLADEDPSFYGGFLSVEVVTESPEQAALVEERFVGAPIAVEGLVLPAGYETPHGTRLKARGLHYAVEQRRAGWNRKPGRCFIVHYDEESVFVPSELRKLIGVLATTDKKVLEGPIYYPLEYMDSSVICRSMEANRPVGCFECRRVMEHGVPLHLHGSNLVVDEEFENEIGWDIGCLDGQPLIAEDYVFGMLAYLIGGSEPFGWHGCVMLEQPPFSVKSAFRQRHRWIFGVLQGMAMSTRMPRFHELPRRQRFRLTWSTRYRVATFALGAIIGVLALSCLPILLAREIATLLGRHVAVPPWPVTAWLVVLGSLWLGSVLVGAWYNVADAGLGVGGRMVEIARAVAIAPLAGVLESAAGLLAVVQWLAGRRAVSWQPTPKTKQADARLDWDSPAP